MMTMRKRTRETGYPLTSGLLELASAICARTQVIVTSLFHSGPDQPVDQWSVVCLAADG